MTEALTAAASNKWVDPLADARWTDLLAYHPRASLFHSRGWLEALSRTYGFEPAALIRVAGDGTVESGAVFCRIDSWLTGRRLVSLPFSDHCDALVRTLDDLAAILPDLTNPINGCRYIEVRPRATSPRFSGPFQPFGGYYLHALQLKNDPRDLLPTFHRNHIVRKIRKSEREGIVYEDGRSDFLLSAFYELLVMTRRRHRVPPQPLRWFRNLVECLPNCLKIRVAFKNRTPIAAIITLQGAREIVYKYGASDARFHSLGGMHCLLWRTIQEGCSLGLETLDLGRTQADNVGGIAFKEHWGATRLPLVYWRSPRWPSTFANKFKEQIAAHLLAHLPDRLFIAAGSALYPHVG